MKRLHFAAACAVGALALTASAENKPTQTNASADRIKVMSADELFDKSVVASDGQSVGEVRYVLVKADDGRIDRIVVDSSMKGSENQLVAIPFSAVRGQLNEGEIRLQTTMDKIGKAPRVTEDQIGKLIDPSSMGETNTYWEPYGAKDQDLNRTTRERGLENEAAGGVGGREDQNLDRDQQIGTGQPQPRQKSPGEKPMTTTPPTDQQGKNAQTMGQQLPKTGNQGETAMGKDMQKGTTMGGESQTGSLGANVGGTGTYILLARSSYRILRPNVSAAPESLEDMTIKSSDGKDLGEIRNVVIDTDQGRVAYTLVGRGGFLGMGMNYVAVPIQAIQLTEQNTLQLKVSSKTFSAMRGYVNDRTPHSVTRSDLERVYKQFKITPYWTTTEEVARRS